MFIKHWILVAVALVVGSTSANALTTYFGEDVNLSGDPNHAPLTLANGARDNFFGTLNGVGTESFEAFPNGTVAAPLSVSFGAAGTAIINGGIVTNQVLIGKYPISGNNYLLARDFPFTIDFTNPVAAFGFYGTDVGDFSGQLSLVLTDVNNNLSTLVIPHTIGVGGSTTGSNLFFGFEDKGDQYTSVKFLNSSPVDNFGFDDFSIGSAAQVANGVPEASTWIMLMIGFLGLAILAGKKNIPRSMQSAFALS